jgi:hypothetical protein
MEESTPLEEQVTKISESIQGFHTKNSILGISHNTKYSTRRKGVEGEDNNDHHGEHKEFG